MGHFWLWGPARGAGAGAGAVVAEGSWLQAGHARLPSTLECAVFHLLRDGATAGKGEFWCFAQGQVTGQFWARVFVCKLLITKQGEL